jgi:hypothetical protein
MHYIGNDKGNVMTMKIMKSNDEKIYLSVNPNENKTNHKKI